MGPSGELVRHIPLSLLYVASGLVRDGFEVVLLDHRLTPRNWKGPLARELQQGAIFVGITVMSGSPIAHAIEVSEFVKSMADIPLVWGGPHATAVPEQMLAKPYIDYVVAGSGVESARRLAHGLADGSLDPTLVAGLGHRVNGRPVLQPPFSGFEPVHYEQIPYHLVRDMDAYGQLGSRERIVPLFSAYGCVYRCAFCSAPQLYQSFHKRWIKVPAAEVVEHIAHVVERLRATEIYFYDDDSFIDLEHIRSVIRGVKARRLSVRLSFRGARVNEVLKMDDAYLAELADAGTHILHIGVESGSQRMLDLFDKGITVDDLLAMNRKLATSTSIIPFYNWILGTPTETLEDMRESMALMLRLVRENPRCCIFQPNKFRPTPGTKLFEIAVACGYRRPTRLEDWIDEELESDRGQPWYTPAMDRLIRMAQVTSYFVDHKAAMILEDKTLRNRIIALVSMLYRPIARLRFGRGLTAALMEYPVYKFLAARARR